MSHYTLFILTLVTTGEHTSFSMYIASNRMWNTHLCFGGKPCAHVSLQIVFLYLIVTTGERTSFGMYTTFNRMWNSLLCFGASLPRFHIQQMSCITFAHANEKQFQGLMTSKSFIVQATPKCICMLQSMDADNIFCNLS